MSEKTVTIERDEYDGLRSAVRLIHSLLHKKEYEDAQTVACISIIAMDLREGNLSSEDAAAIMPAIRQYVAGKLTEEIIQGIMHGSKK